MGYVREGRWIKVCSPRRRPTGIHLCAQLCPELAGSQTLGATVFPACWPPQVPLPLPPRGRRLPPPPAIRPYNKQVFPRSSPAATALGDLGSCSRRGSLSRKGAWPRLAGLAGCFLGPKGGGARRLSPGRRERCERAPRAHWSRWATLPGLDWAAARKGCGLSPLVLIGLSALVLGTAAGRGGGAGGEKGQVRAELGGWHQFAHALVPVLADRSSW